MSEYSERCMKFSLNKETLPLLLQSTSDYLVIDFFDLCQPVAAFSNTTFSTYDYTFYNTSTFRKNRTEFSEVDFLSIPIFLWYGYVDAYFQQVTKKHAGNIILNRLNCSGVYMTKSYQIKSIPERLLYFGNAKI